jgi:glycosyltransferase involved in cell wall biosynthesis
MPRLLLHFARYGPYHHARLRSAHEVLTPLGWEVIGLETAGTDATYAWDETKGMNDGPKVVTAFPGRVHEEITAAEYRRGLFPLLDALAPTAMAIAGWGSTDAQLCLAWCRKNDVRRIVMSETRAADGKRVWWKELIKRHLISRFDGALVGGKSHRDYLVKLGMPPERIAFGYNVVDNDYFRNGRAPTAGRAVTSPAGWEENESASGGPAARDEVGRPGGPSLPYFLASNRFIERKNLARLIEAYGAYARRGQESGDRDQESDGGTQQSIIKNPQSSIVNQSAIWPLVLLGDGEQKSALIAQCHELGLNVKESAPWESTKDQGPRTKDAPQAQCTVFLPGFRQIDELPRFYAHAGCFIHPALEEPWGLVINEAMACGLPILASNHVGAAEELVDDGVNGWTFDPENVEEMAGLMLEISAADFPLATFSTASRRILEERCPTQAFGKGLAQLLG